MGRIAKWLKIGQEINDQKTAEVQDKVEQAEDPRIQLERAIATAQDNHDRHQKAVASVIATRKMADAKLVKLKGQASQLEQQIRVELADGSDESKAKANTLAISLAGVRENVTSQESFCATAAQHADAALHDAQVSQEQLQTVMAQRGNLLEKLSQAKEQEAFNDTSAAMSSTSTSGLEPTLAMVTDKIERESAEAAGTAEVAQFDPNVQQAEVNHDMIQASAQSILDEFAPKAPKTKPAAK